MHTCTRTRTYTTRARELCFVFGILYIYIYIYIYVYIICLHERRALHFCLVVSGAVTNASWFSSSPKACRFFKTLSAWFSISTEFAHSSYPSRRWNHIYIVSFRQKNTFFKFFFNYWSRVGPINMEKIKLIIKFW